MSFRANGLSSGVCVYYKGVRNKRFHCTGKNKRKHSQPRSKGLSFPAPKSERRVGGRERETLGTRLKHIKKLSV